MPETLVSSVDRDEPALIEVPEKDRLWFQELNPLNPYYIIQKAEHGKAAACADAMQPLWISSDALIPERIDLMRRVGWNCMTSDTM